MCYSFNRTQDSQRCSSVRRSALACILLLTWVLPGLYGQQQIPIKDLPSDFFGKWYRTDGSDQEMFHFHDTYAQLEKQAWTYGMTKQKQDEYLLLLEKNRRKRVYFVKHIDADYIEIASVNKQYKLYKKDRFAPNTRNIAAFAYASALEGKWYSTAGKNDLLFELKVGYISTGGIPWTIDFVEKRNDTWWMLVKNGTLSQQWKFKKNHKDYLKVKIGDGAWQLAKFHPSAPDGIATTKRDIPPDLMGVWYTTEPTARQAFEVSYGKVNGNNIQSLSKQGETYELRLGSGDRYYFKNIDPLYMECAGTNKQFQLYKRSPSSSNNRSMSGKQLPSSWRRNWYSKDTKHAWVLAIHSNYWIEDAIFWNYGSIVQDGYSWKIELRHKEQIKELRVVAKNGELIIQHNNGETTVLTDQKGRS